MLFLDEVRRRAALMDVARRMGTQAGLPFPDARTVDIEDRVVTGEISISQAVSEWLALVPLNPSSRDPKVRQD